LVNSVVFVVQRFPGYGGAEEYVFQLAKRLAEEGVICTILTSDLDKRSPVGLPESVKVVKLPVLFKIGEYAIWRGLLKVLLATNADVFHVNTYGYFHTDVVSFFHRLKRSKVVLTSHGFHGLEKSLLQREDASWRGRFRSAFRPFYDFTLGFNEIKGADALIALSSHDIEIFKWMGAEERRIHEISLGVRDLFFDDSDKKLQANLLSRLGGNPVILSVGELSWVKGKDIPLRALVSLLKDYPKAKLVYVGKDGGMERYLRKLAARLGVQESVTFVGYVRSEDLVNYYGVADVLVHTSYAEGLSTVILEAMASGLLVISTPAGGNAQLLKKCGAGIVVPFNDPRSVYLALNKILIDKSFRKALSVNGSTYAMTYLRWDKITRKHRNLYENLSHHID
jgi:glycosyltransferase involved in cell wall biosynthesis